MGNFPVSRLWANLIVISGTWGSSFVFVKLPTESMNPFAFAASRGFIAMSALLVWLASRGRTLPAYDGTSQSPPWKADSLGAKGVHYNASLYCTRGALAAVAKARAG